MRSFLLTLVLTLTWIGVTKAQFPKTYSVPATGAKISTAKTDSTKLYRLTVTGVYSMWPQFTDCHGVDAAYVYDVPQEEIDNLRWPPPVIRIGTLEIPFVAIPHWVGDDYVWAFPTPPSPPLFELSFRRYKGFRVDDAPLANVGLTPLHRYQLEKMGTGRPFLLQILDSNYQAGTGSVVPRYEDNCGALSVRMEVVGSRDLNICDAQRRCNAVQRTNGLILWTSLFETNGQGVRVHRMSGVNRSQFRATSNRGVTLTIDSISCAHSNVPVAVGMLVDRSGSMAQFISPSDPTVRMTASKAAISRFIDRLREKDSAFVMSFDEEITLDQDWTTDKNKLRAAVDALEPGGMTKFFGAVETALEKMSRSNAARRALIVLSDGANTVAPFYTPPFLEFVQSVNVPVYIIALGLSDDLPDIDGRMKMQKIADASRGRVFDVRNSASLDSVYIALGNEITQEDCCGVFISMPPCLDGTSHTITLTYTPSSGSPVSQSIAITCDSCAVTTGVEGLSVPSHPSLELSCTPSLIHDRATLYFRLAQTLPVRIEVFDLAGRQLMLVYEGPLNAGPHTQDLTLSSLPAGNYILCLTTPHGRATQYVKRLY